jgi:Protein of unknown function (DUF1353)
MWKFLFGALAIVAVSYPACAESGRFKGEVVAQFLRDGRNMKLTERFGYVDPVGKHWDVPAGTETDGASIPQALWIMYPPFTGKYRLAAVVHDHFCQSRSETWKATHAVFYDALITAGVDRSTATLMWAGVYGGGPRWGPGYRSGSRGPISEAAMTKEEELLYLQEMERWIIEENPSLDEIAARLDRGKIRPDIKR